MRAAAAVGLPFALVTAPWGLDHGVFAVFGGYAVAYGTREPYARRGPLLGVVVAGLTASAALGLLAAADLWLSAVVLPLIAVVTVLGTSVLRASGPNGFIFILVGALCVFLPYEPGQIPARTGCLLIGSAFAWLLGMSGRLRCPYGPEHRAAADAYRRTAALLETCGAAAAGPWAVRDARDALRSARITLAEARGSRQRHAPAVHLRLAALLLRLEAVVDEAEALSAAHPADRVPESWPRALGELADAMAAPGQPVPAAPPGLADAPDAARTTLRSAVAEAVRTAAAPPDDFADADPAALPEPDRIRDGLRRGFTSRTSALSPALRTGAAVALAAVVAQLLPLTHPAWVALGAASALQGGKKLRLTDRVLRRALGNLAGVLVVALVFHSSEPPGWAMPVAVVVLYAVGQSVIVGNLALGSALTTLTGLLLAYLANSRFALGDLAAARLIDMALGLLIGLVAGALPITFRRAPRGGRRR